MSNHGPTPRGVRTLLTLAGAAVTAGLSAQTAAAPAAAEPSAASTEEEIVVLSPFEVSASADTGYVATDTLAGTRIRSDLKDIGSAISVVTKDLMNDIGATDSRTLLQYTTNAETGGSQGTFSGLNGKTDEGAILVNPTTAQRIRGLTSADNTRDFYVSDIPWDSYNVDRIDILRGPNSFLFGLGSPAGIQNASLQGAGFKTQGKVEYRLGSWGSQRASINDNQVLIDDVLAIRVAGLLDHQNFRQKPAFENNNRIYGALRWDPKLFSNPSFKTSFKVKYEAGDIKANRPRTMTPIDKISAWYRPTTVSADNPFGGMGKAVVSNPYYVRLSSGVVAGDGKGQMQSGSANFSPWFSETVSPQQPYWSVDGATGELYSVKGGWINAGALSSTGGSQAASVGVPGKTYSNGAFSILGLAQRATTPNYALPLSQYGGYKDQSLTDASIFDFYNTLIDGPNKSEFQRWTAYNIDFYQTAWDDRVGLNLTYDKQMNKFGGESLLGWAPAISIDLLQNPEDYYLTSSGTGVTNPNFGRPFVVGGGNSGSGNWTRTERETYRASLFGELRVSDLTENKFLVKLLGKHRFNGVASKDSYFVESRSYQMYANNQTWAGYWNGTSGATSSITDRPPTAFIYLGDSVANLASASGANIPGITSRIDLADSPIYLFDPTPVVPVSTYANPWTVPTGSSLSPVFGSTATTQASNPANMIGWTNYTKNTLMRANGGENLDLLTAAQKQVKKTLSFAGSYQGFFWNNAFVLTMGWRYDEVRTKGVRAGVQSLNRNILNMSDTAYAMPSSVLPADVNKGHSLNGGGVLHLNRILPKDPLPIDIRLSYAKSDNFQVVPTRHDLYNNSIGNPSGNTKEYGVLLSTKDNKYSFRVVKFETAVNLANSSLEDSAIGSIVSNGLNWRNVFLYQLGGYDYATRGQDSYRNQWTNAYRRYIQHETSPGVWEDYAAGTPERIAGDAAALARMNAAITGWNDIQKWLGAKGFFSAWNFNPTGPDTALVDRATYLTNPTQYAPNVATVYSYTTSQPQNFAVTADTVSKGYEFEFTANPTTNWRVTFNAAKTEAVRNNVGGAALTEFVEYMSSKLLDPTSSTGLTAAGEVPRWGGAANAIGSSVYAPWLAKYTKMKLQEGTLADEIRKWRFNLMTNYSFSNGLLKGAGIGGAYRWQDKVVIGYPVLNTGVYDLSQPYYGPSESAVDVWLSYERKLTSKINWKIQLNVRNLFADSSLIPMSVEPDGKTWATVRIPPNREWFVTNTFSF